MGALAVEQVYRYQHPSELDRDRRVLRLATSTHGGEEHPHFFTGDLLRPERTARLLLSLMAIVQARFHIPAAMLERILIQSDPVVTSSDDRLRFEGFSACCGAYARVDLHPEALSGERFGRGTYSRTPSGQMKSSALSTAFRGFATSAPTTSTVALLR